MKVLLFIPQTHKITLVLLSFSVNVTIVFFFFTFAFFLSRVLFVVFFFFFYFVCEPWISAACPALCYGCLCVRTT